jgi:hypothetical protein
MWADEMNVAKNPDASTNITTYHREKPGAYTREREVRQQGGRVPSESTTVRLREAFARFPQKARERAARGRCRRAIVPRPSAMHAERTPRERAGHRAPS